MKNLLIWAGIISVLTSCKESLDAPTDNLVFMRSFITTYVDGTMNLYSYEAGQEATEIHNSYLLFTNMDVEHTYGMPPGATEEEAERFMEIAERNGDLSYNRYEPEFIFSNTCCADNFKSIEIKCLNAAWDEAHPAGSSLNDIVSIHHCSYADYIHKGYPDNYKWGAEQIKAMNELTEEDLAMIDPYIEFYFSSLPPAGSYEMEVTFVTTEGEKKTATCTLVIE